MKPHTTPAGPANSTLVGNGMYYEKGYVRSPANRSAIYPDFDPDYNCLFDIFQFRHAAKDFLKLSQSNELHYTILGTIARAKEKVIFSVSDGIKTTSQFVEGSPALQNLMQETQRFADEQIKNVVREIG